jgi:hypothetical protein
MFVGVLRHVRGNVVARPALRFAQLGLAAVLTAAVVLGVVVSASAAPLTAKFKPVPSRAVTRTISAARGGTLTVTAPGGVRIIVKIPPGALLADTTVTATPISRFRIAPVHGGFVAGVQLAPDGLQLLKPGSVEFRARKGLRPRRRYFLGSQGNGSDVHLVPPAFRKVGRGPKAKLRVVSKPIVPIMHFSTEEAFDWSTTSLGDLSDIAYPQSAIDRVAQEIAKQLSIERQAQMLGLRDQVDYTQMLKVMDRVRDRVIKPRIQVVLAALTNRCSMQAVGDARGALVLALGFVRQEQLLGLPDSFDTATLMGPLLKGTGNCMLQQCSRYGPRLAQSLVATARQVELIGASASEAFYNALLRNLVACSKGEVHVDSTFTDDSESGASIHIFVRAGGRAPFEAAPDGRSWIYDEAPLEYQDVHGGAQITDGDCGAESYRSSLSANSNGVFRISQLIFGQLDPAKPDASPPIEKLSLAITQDPTERETFVSNCGNWTNTIIGDPLAIEWLRFFGANHPHANGETNPAIRAPSFNGPDFVPERAPVIALAVYTQDTGSFTENTLIEVISKPGPIEPMPDPFKT